MNQNLKEFILKFLYSVAGLLVASAIPFVNSNAALFGGSAAIIVAVLAVIEQSFFPSTPTA